MDDCVGLASTINPMNHNHGHVKIIILTVNIVIITSSKQNEATNTMNKTTSLPCPTGCVCVARFNCRRRLAEVTCFQVQADFGPNI